MGTACLPCRIFTFTAMSNKEVPAMEKDFAIVSEDKDTPHVNAASRRGFSCAFCLRPNGGAPANRLCRHFAGGVLRGIHPGFCDQHEIRL